MLQVLARSATGERMNPYTSLWTGVTPGDGPQRFHVVLLDNGRSSILAKPTRAPDPQVHPLRRLHEHLPGLSPDRRPRLRLGLSRPHRRHSHSAADADATRAVAALRLIALRRLLRSLPGQDQYSRSAARTARPGGRPGAPAPPAASSIPCISACASPICSSPERWLFHAAQCLRPHRPALLHRAKTDGFTRCPASARKWTQTRDLRGLPSQTFHEWWAERDLNKGGQMSAPAQSRQQILDRIRAATPVRSRRAPRIRLRHAAPHLYPRTAASAPKPASN